MPIQFNDILLAFKHIALSEHLNGTEKQFAAFLVDSYNKKSGRCDPSEGTAAYILGKSKRTIIRAGNRLVAHKLFIRRRHAGNNHCNSYHPNWEMVRELERQFKDRRKQWAQRFERTKLSPSERQPCRSRDDNAVTQTSLMNNIQLTYVAAAADSSNQQRAESNEVRVRNKEKASIRVDNALSPYLGPPSSRQAAEISAQRRWNNDLLDQFRSTPAYAVIVEALDAPLQDAATKAELKRRGAGITSILQGLALRGIQWK
jgi:hypothetical protein